MSTVWISWIAYALVIGCVVAAAARLLEGSVRLAGRPVRWVWAGALALTVAMVALAPQRVERLRTRTMLDGAATDGVGPSSRARVTAGPSAMVAAMRRAVAAPVESAVRAAGEALPDGAGRWLVAGWVGLSATLTLLVALVLLRFRRARRAWPAAVLHGTPVRIAPDAGPAVVGLSRPEIVVPRWLLDRTADEQRLVLAHEREHVRAHDPALLAAACASVALLPWHPAAWYMLSRLRLAVELDCDARVLRRGVAPRFYGSLLIDLAGRCSGLRVGAPALADESSHLEQRLLAMKPTSVRFAHLRGISLAALSMLAVLAACEAKMPTAVEVENMDVAAAERGARKTALIALGDSLNTDYTVDGRLVPAAEARSIRAEDIASIAVRRLKDGSRSSVDIRTRASGAPEDGFKTRELGTANGETMRVRVRDLDEPSVAGETDVVVGSRTFDGLVIIDGVISSGEAMAALAPGRIASVEVIKGDGAAKLYPNEPDAKRGVIRITTRN